MRVWGARRELDIAFVAPGTMEEVGEWEGELMAALVNFLVVNALAREGLGLELQRLGALWSCGRAKP